MNVMTYYEQHRTVRETVETLQKGSVVQKVLRTSLVKIGRYSSCSAKVKEGIKTDYQKLQARLFQDWYKAELPNEKQCILNVGCFTPFLFLCGFICLSPCPREVSP